MISIRALLIVVLTLTLAACATRSPKFGPETTVDNAYMASPTLPNAVSVAESMKKRYIEQVENRAGLERTVGLGLIGLATVASDLALRGVGKTELIGMASVAGGAYGASSWIAGKPQQLVFAAGATAVQCAVDTMQPLILAYPEESFLASNIPQIRTGASQLEATLKRDFSSPSDLSLPRVVRARASVERAKAFLPVATQVHQVLVRAGSRLRSSLSAIEGEVTFAYTNNSGTLVSLVQSLGNALPTTGAKIIGATLPGIPAAGSNKVKTSGDDDKLDVPTQNLEDLLVATEPIVERIRSEPADERLRLCNVNLKDSGIVLVAAPTELTIEAGREGTVVVSGGVLPYSYSFFDAHPPSEQVDVFWDSGSGHFNIKAKSTAQQGTYFVRFADAGKGQQTVQINVGAGKTTSSAVIKVKKQDKPVIPACTKLSRVEEAQQGLIDRKVTSAKINGIDKPLIVDGCMGSVTLQAMRDFYSKSTGTAASEKMTEEVLLKSIEDLLLQ